MIEKNYLNEIKNLIINPKYKLIKKSGIACNKFLIKDETNKTVLKITDEYLLQSLIIKFNNQLLNLKEKHKISNIIFILNLIISYNMSETSSELYKLQKNTAISRLNEIIR